MFTTNSLRLFSTQSNNRHLLPALINQLEAYALRSFKIYISCAVVRFEPLLLWHSEARKFHGPQLKVFCVFMGDSENAELALVVMGAILLRSGHISDREWREYTPMHNNRDRPSPISVCLPICLRPACASI